MYKPQLPDRSELPSIARLTRQAIAAVGVAAVLVITVVLPAEYGIDPTTAGRLLSLTEMGEIKSQLAREAEADHRGDQPGFDTEPKSVEEEPSAPDRRWSRCRSWTGWYRCPSASRSGRRSPNRRRCSAATR